MIGLLKKDILLTLLNKKMYIILVCVAAILIATSQAETSTLEFLISYSSIIIGMGVLTTITMDDSDHGNSYLMTLPITRKLYIIEKYIFALIELLIGWLGSTAICSLILLFLNRSVFWEKWFIECSLIFVCMSVILYVMIPVQLKFGGDNGRIVILGFVAFIFAVVFGATFVMNKTGTNEQIIVSNFLEIFHSVTVWLWIICGLFINLLLLYISYFSSLHIFRKKQF